MNSPFRMFIVTLLFCITTVGFSQSNGCDAIVYWKYTQDIHIYDKPDARLLKTLRNDTLNENFLSLTILDEQKNWFLVDISLGMSDKSYHGWIEKNWYIGAFARHEKYPMKLTLYRNPVLNELEKTELNDWQPGLITINRCLGKWVFVTVAYKGQEISGWIMSNELCANNYSTCS